MTLTFERLTSKRYFVRINQSREPIGTLHVDENPSFTVNGAISIEHMQEIIDFAKRTPRDEFVDSIVAAYSLGFATNQIKYNEPPHIKINTQALNELVKQMGFEPLTESEYKQRFSK